MNRAGFPRLATAYAGMLLGAVGLFLVIRRLGETLAAPPPGIATAMRSGATGRLSPVDAAAHVLLALLAVAALGRLLGALLQRLGQPPVVGEVLAGIVLGPSLLGHVAPRMSEYILPPSVAPLLGGVALIGIVLYMFLVGLQLNPDLVRSRAHTTVATSHASIVAPFVLGAALALYLYPRLSTSDVRFTSFALFMGIAMSITAFPVLARILADRGLTRTELGAVALTCAAADDVTAWCLLALVVGVAQARIQDAVVVMALTVVFVALMFLVVRPILGRSLREFDRRPAGHVLAIVGVLLSALATEWIGIHAVFGAFLFGAVFPHDSAVARRLVGPLQKVVTTLLLPAFFAFAGMRTEIGLISGASQWLLCSLIIAVATLGKFGGTFAAARFTGMDWRGAAGLGVLMNTRGLMELVVLNIGLDLRVISPTLFTMMVLMALLTTVATTPALRLLGIDRA